VGKEVLDAATEGVWARDNRNMERLRKKTAHGGDPQARYLRRKEKTRLEEEQKK